MNCKPGDLAIQVGCDPEDGDLGRQDIGRLVVVIDRGDDWSHVGDHRFHWWIKPASGGLIGCFDEGGKYCLEPECDIPDEHLRPLRDQDGEDEVLRLVGKPETVGA